MFLGQHAERLRWVKTDRRTNVEIFRNIEATIATLVFGDIGGWFTKALGQHG